MENCRLTFTPNWLTFIIFMKSSDMTTEINEKPTKRHIGHNIQKVRVYLGVKQEALAADMGIGQQALSKIEQDENVGEELLASVAKNLGVSPEVIRDFDLEKAIYNINHSNYRDATISEGATTYAISQQVNPIEKIVELYERLLKSEREKVEILTNKK